MVFYPILHRTVFCAHKFTVTHVKPYSCSSQQKSPLNPVHLFWGLYFVTESQFHSCCRISMKCTNIVKFIWHLYLSFIPILSTSFDDSMVFFCGAHKVSIKYVTLVAKCATDSLINIKMFSLMKIPPLMQETKRNIFRHNTMAVSVELCVCSFALARAHTAWQLVMTLFEMCI